MGTKETAMKLVAILIVFSFFNASCTENKEDKSGSSQIEKMQINLNKLENIVTSTNDEHFDDFKTIEQTRKGKREIVRKASSSKDRKKITKGEEKNEKRAKLKRKWQKKKKVS